jgi:hypothetical protein
VSTQGIGRHGEILKAVEMLSLIEHTKFDDNGSPYYLFPRRGASIKFTLPDVAMRYWVWWHQWQRGWER